VGIIVAVAAPPAVPVTGSSPIVELRQYTLRPGQRDVLIDLFDSRLVESQEATGMTIIGQFRDLDRPNRFVWLRGFEDMEERARSLAAFYGGPVWRTNSAAANATMIDSEDVLLLRPARPESAFQLCGSTRQDGADGNGDGVVEATILYLDGSAATSRAVDLFEEAIAPAVAERGGTLLAYFVTESSENTFPALPVREGDDVLVWCVGYADRQSFERASTRAGDLSHAAAGALGAVRSPGVLRLAPTARSLLDGRSRGLAAINNSTRKELR
jgi:NIPSNAP